MEEYYGEDSVPGMMEGAEEDEEVARRFAHDDSDGEFSTDRPATSAAAKTPSAVRGDETTGLSTPRSTASRGTHRGAMQPGRPDNWAGNTRQSIPAPPPRSAGPARGRGGAGMHARGRGRAESGQQPRAFGHDLAMPGTAPAVAGRMPAGMPGRGGRGRGGGAGAARGRGGGPSPAPVPAPPPPSRPLAAPAPPPRTPPLAPQVWGALVPCMQTMACH